MNTKTHITAVTLSLLLLTAFTTQAASAEEAVAQGRALAYTCMGCHGIEGYRNAYPSYRVPRLGGQKSAYIKTALTAYRDGSRRHPTMRAQASSLSDDDIGVLAAYFESQGSASDDVDADDVAGFASAALCVTCHGVAGTGVAPQPPVLSGQQQDYLAHALQQYKGGMRTGNIMAGFAASLSDEDIATLAAFYAAQSGLHTPDKDR